MRVPLQRLHGFTLIELLVVPAIIAALAGLLLATLSGPVVGSREHRQPESSGGWEPGRCREPTPAPNPGIAPSLEPVGGAGSPIRVVQLRAVMEEGGIVLSAMATA